MLAMSESQHHIYTMCSAVVCFRNHGFIAQVVHKRRLQVPLNQSAARTSVRWRGAVTVKLALNVLCTPKATANCINIQTKGCRAENIVAAYAR